jgi:single-strand DNA-binding protein
MAYDSKGTLNKVMLIGRLGADPELKYTPRNIAVASISIATNTSYKKDGKTEENTEWHRVVAWRSTAEFLSNYAQKGSQVYVEGKLQTRSWDDKDGNKKYMTEIVADNVQLLGGGKKREEQHDSPPPMDNPVQPEGEDDLPF